MGLINFVMVLTSCVALAPYHEEGQYASVIGALTKLVAASAEWPKIGVALPSICAVRTLY